VPYVAASPRDVISLTLCEHAACTSGTCITLKSRNMYVSPQVRSVLDVCSGCGVQGLVAAMTYAESAVLVELNRRAARFARFNTVLNGCEDRVRVLEADLLQR
jgi:tRNA1(Val) A37 N6-methylase TrmN6